MEGRRIDVRECEGHIGNRPSSSDVLEIGQFCALSVVVVKAMLMCCRDLQFGGMWTYASSQVAMAHCC